MSKEAVFEGEIKSIKFEEFEPKDGGKAIPILALNVEVPKKDGTTKIVTPKLWFSDELITSGYAAGKSRVQDALEMLASYDVPVDTENLGQNDPMSWEDHLVGQNAVVFVKIDEEGKMKCYLNKRGRPEIAPDRVRELWAGVTGGAKTSKSATAPSKGVDTGLEDDDLPF